MTSKIVCGCGGSAPPPGRRGVAVPLVGAAVDVDGNLDGCEVSLVLVENVVVENVVIVVVNRCHPFVWLPVSAWLPMLLWLSSFCLAAS